QILEGRMDSPEDLSDPPARLKPLLEQPLRIPLIQPLDHLPDEAAREERNSLDVLRHAIRFPGREDLGRVPALTEHPQLDGDFLLGHTGVALPFFQLQVLSEGILDPSKRSESFRTPWCYDFGELRRA